MHDGYWRDIGRHDDYEEAQAEIDAVCRAIRTSYGYIEMGLDDSLSVALHGTFDETASNASTLGALDAA